MFYVWQWIGFSVRYGFLAMFVLEFSWELMENSERVIKRYRETSGTSGDYQGDSYQNILGDLTACQTGYLLSLIFRWFPINEVVPKCHQRNLEITKPLFSQ